MAENLEHIAGMEPPMGTLAERRVHALGIRSIYPLFLALSGCALACEFEANRTAADASVVRPGDTLFDHSDEVRIEAYPETNLPPDVAALVGSTVRVTHPLNDPLEWDLMPTPKNADRFEADGADVSFYMTEPTLTLAPFAERPILVRNGEPEPDWDQSRQRSPGQAAEYRHRTGLVRAIGKELPLDLALRYEAISRAFFDGIEPMSNPAPTRASDLRRSYELDEVTGGGLLIPAPGAVSFRLPSVPEELQFTVSVVDRSWEVVDGTLTPHAGLSDGVEFRVEAVSASETEPQVTNVLWRRHVTPAEGFVPGRVDLSSYAGRGLILRLVSDPGPQGDPFFDYAFWGRPRFRGRPVRTAPQPHVVLIDIDTLRADRVGRRSGQRDLTPRLDRWADEHAVVFSQAWSSSTWTLPSTVSILTGLSVNQHQVTLPNKKMTRAHRSLAGILSDAGYETYALAEGGFVGSDFGFADGFDVFDARRFQDVDWEQAHEWLATRRRSERPFFLFLHTYSVHDPFEADARFLPHPGYGGTLAGKPVTAEEVLHNGDAVRSLNDEERNYIKLLYDAGVQRFDESLGVFLDRLEEEFADEELIVIVSSDHGEEFFEHGGTSHGGVSEYEELLHVPLIVRLPNAMPQRVDVPVSTLDIVPTVLEAVGLDVPANLSGQSLSGPVEPQIVINEGRPGLRAVRVGDLKLIENDARSTKMLFDLRSDPGEKRDLSASRPAEVQRLSRLLDEHLSRYGDLEQEKQRNRGFDARTLKRLKRLGYLGD